MKSTLVSVGVALGSWLAMTMAAEDGQSLTLSTSAVEKRDAFSCYGSTNTSVSDCQSVIDTIHADAHQNFTLYANICVVWDKASCRVRLCAQPYITRPLNRTASWLATYISSPLLDSCIGQGKMGVLSDHPNINSHSGTYRLWVY
ncbi:hypothetical protein GGR52DRAFT_557178 [Hypoxylon sp. FL1284]|nr:hypothetical protein GGR52DRAFT_557178 [Hypoxylon sp. FL1284]